MLKVARQNLFGELGAVRHHNRRPTAMHNGIGRRVNGQERQFGQQPERASRRAGGNKLFVHQEDPGRLCNHSQRPHPSPHLMLSVSSPFERISCNFERKGASVTGWLLSDASSPRGESTSSCRASFSSARVWFDDIVLSRVESTKKILYKTKWRPRIPAAETKSQWLVLGVVCECVCHVLPISRTHYGG